jgi:hypothetical protein
MRPPRRFISLCPLSLTRRRRVVPADHREAGAVGGEGGGGQARRGDHRARPSRPGRHRGAPRAPDPADAPRCRAPRQVARPGPRRVRRGAREGLLRRRQGKRAPRMPLLPRQLALQGALASLLPMALCLMAPCLVSIRISCEVDFCWEMVFTLRCAVVSVDQGQILPFCP